MARASLNLSARVAKSSINYCEYYTINIPKDVLRAMYRFVGDVRERY